MKLARIRCDPYAPGSDHSKWSSTTGMENGTQVECSWIEVDGPGREPARVFVRKAGTKGYYFSIDTACLEAVEPVTDPPQVAPIEPDPPQPRSHTAVMSCGCHFDLHRDLITKPSISR